MRADSAYNAVANRVEFSRQDDVDYIIKWNSRKQDVKAWKTLAFSKGKVETPRPGKRATIFSFMERHSATDEKGSKKEVASRRVVQVTECTIDKKQQLPLIHEKEFEG